MCATESVTGWLLGDHPASPDSFSESALGRTSHKQSSRRAGVTSGPLGVELPLFRQHSPRPQQTSMGSRKGSASGVQLGPVRLRWLPHRRMSRTVLPDPMAHLRTVGPHSGHVGCRLFSPEGRCTRADFHPCQAARTVASTSLLTVSPDTAVVGRIRRRHPPPPADPALATQARTGPPPPPSPPSTPRRSPRRRRIARRRSAAVRSCAGLASGSPP